MFKKVVEEKSTHKKSIADKMRKISYDEHFTPAASSLDLVRDSRFVDIGDKYEKHSDAGIDKLTK